jgi:hypothetical protein
MFASDSSLLEPGFWHPRPGNSYIDKINGSIASLDTSNGPAFNKAFFEGERHHFLFGRRRLDLVLVWRVAETPLHFGSESYGKTHAQGRSYLCASAGDYRQYGPGEIHS